MSANIQFDFTDKWVVVTGSTKGIGFSIAKNFAIANAKVIVNGRTQESVDEAVNEMKKDKSFKNEEVHVYGIVGDLSSTEGSLKFCKDIDDMIQKETKDEERTLDVLVNNIGIFAVKPFEEIEDEEWMNYFNVNVMITVRMCRYFLPKMLAKSKKDSNYFGRIVNISSECGLRPIPFMMHYSVTRTSILGLSRGLAELTKGSNVTVNSLLPGPTLTEGVDNYFVTLTEEEKKEDPSLTKDKVMADYFKKTETTSLLQRYLTTDEVANTALFLSSKNASGINGASQKVDGGIVRCI